MNLPKRKLEVGRWREVLVDTHQGKVLVLERQVGKNLIQRIDAKGDVSVFDRPWSKPLPPGKPVPRGLGPLQRPQFPLPAGDETKMPVPSWDRRLPGPYPVNRNPRVGLARRSPATTQPTNTVMRGRAW